MLLSHLYELAPSTTQETETGTYAAVTFSEDTVASIAELQEKLEVPNPLDPSDFHSTLLYSRKPLPNYIAKGELTPVVTSDTEDFTLQIWPSNGGEKNVLVMTYPCDWLTERWEALMEEHDASWDFPDFTPHVTLSYDVGDWKPSEQIVHFTSQKPIVIVNEYSKPLDEDWSK